MSQVQPYAPGSTGTLSDVIERGPELAPFTPAGPDGFKPPPSFGELFQAARPGQLQAQPLYDQTKLSEGYAPIVDALGLPSSENPGAFYGLDDATAARVGSLGQPSELATGAGVGEELPFGRHRLATRPLQEQLIVQQIRARRAGDPQFLAGVPDTVEGLHDYFEKQQAAKRAAGAQVLARGSPLGRFGAELGAGFVEQAVHNPFTLPTLVIGGGTASSVIQAIGRDALINGVLTAGQLPIEAHNMAENGEALTAKEAVSQVVQGAVFGGLFGAAVHIGAEHVPPLVFKAMPESVQQRWAARMKVGDVRLSDVLGDMDNRELSGFARSTLGERMTPDEKGAADALERSQEIGEASPFTPGPVGDAAHNAGLADALKSIIDGAHSSGAPIQTNRGALLSSTSSVVRAPEPVVVPEDPAFGAQWAAIKGNEHGIGSHGEFLTSRKGAVGPAQVMPGTAPYAAKLAGLPWDEARYRADRAYNEALGRAYYAEQLHTFGDPDKAAAAYNAGPGNASRGTGLRGAMRKAAEHGEPGNWEAYLPHETQRYVEDFRKRTGESPPARQPGQPSADGLGGDDEIAALQRSAGEAEAEGLALSRDRSATADVPVLKRELFADDQGWADAQAAFHQSLNAPEEAAGGPLERETPAEPPEPAEVPPAAAPGALPAAAERARASRIVSRLDDAEHPGFAELGVATSHGDVFWSAATGKTTVIERGGFSREVADPDGSIFEQHVAGEDPAIVPPLTRAELEAIGRPANARLDPLWYAGLNAVTERELGHEPKPLWALRNKNTEEIVSWGVKRAAVEAEKAKFWEPDQLDLERLHPENIARELRERAVDQAARAVAADIRFDEPELKLFDEPGGAGAKDQAASLEHDARMAAADQLAGEQTLERNRQRPRETGLTGEAAKPVATFVQDPAQIRAKGQRKRNYYLAVTEHADHKAAKAGDLDAGERLVDQLVRPADLERAATRFAGARFVPVSAEEAGGRNVIPQVLARRYADAAGGTVDPEIVQADRAFHTGAGPAERIVRRAHFDGPVVRGERYVLVDDVAAMGGSIAELADHIQRGGGKVEGVVLLASGVDDFAPTPKQIRAIHDGGYAELFRHFAGIEPEALTRPEAEWALGRSPGRVRDQLAEAVVQGNRGRARGAVGGEEGQDGLAAGGGGSVAAAPRTYDVGDGKPKTLGEILDELDADRAAIAALRACADGEA